jgi:hypothetical protein
MTDNKYHKGKIYTIRSFQTEQYYIGSTCDALHKRLYNHRRDYKNYLNNKYGYFTSFDIIKYEDNYIELLEDYKCESKNELLKREGELIRKYKDDIVNYRIEGRTRKEHYEENKDKIKDYNIKYYEDNKDKINEQKKKYYVDNKDKFKDKHKEYYEDNKDKIKEHKTKLYDCECGKTQLQLGDKSKHIKSKFHLNHI